MELSEFLLARIAEDEEKARAAMDAGWTPTMPPPIVWTDHFARHMPARVLAKCEAKRRIVEWLITEKGGPEPFDVGVVLDDVCQMLAQPYADHPDFREVWKA